MSFTHKNEIRTKPNINLITNNYAKSTILQFKETIESVAFDGSVCVQYGIRTK